MIDSIREAMDTANKMAALAVIAVLSSCISVTQNHMATTSTGAWMNYQTTTTRVLPYTVRTFILIRTEPQN